MFSLIQDTESTRTAVEKLQDQVVAYAPRVLGALVTLVVGWIVVKMIVGLIHKVIARTDADETLEKFFASMASMSLKVILVMMVIGQLGAETASFIAVLGAATFAVGFALQGSLSSFAAGVMILIFRPFKVGDFVEAGGAMGTVDQVGIFATIIKTGDNKKVVVSNSSITGGNIINYSAYEKRRVDMEFGISYDDDIDKAKSVLRDILEKDTRVHSDPEPFVALAALADSSVNFKVRAWVDSGDYWGVYFDTHEQVKKRFDAEGISIPFPQRDVHVHQVA